MNFKIVWLPEAENDMAGLHDYYAQFSLRTARKYYNSILHEVGLLRNHPQAAAVELLLEEKTKKYRSLVVAHGRYKVVYLIQDNHIYIVPLRK